MTNVLIRDLSDDTHRELVRRAAARGQSLQQYLAAELNRLAAAPTIEDVLDRVEARRDGGTIGLLQAVDDLAAERPGQ